MRRPNFLLIFCRLLAVILLEPSSVTGGTQQIVEEPQETRALLGSTAVLRCKVQNQNGPVTWMKDGFLLGVERRLPAYPRYTMIGSSAYGEYHLEIKNVHVSDDAEYQCQIAATAEQPVRKSAPVKLTVLVTPGYPRITPPIGPVSAREGRNVTLTCQTDGSKPAAFISWALMRHANGTGFLRKLYAPNESIIKNRGHLNDVQSTLEYAPQRSDDGSFIACMVEHETLVNPLVTSVQLRIQYSPRVNVTLNSTEPLLEHRRATLACNVDAYPSDNLRFIWYQNQQVLHGRNDRHLLISPLSVQHHHNSVFRCHVDNDVGDGGFGDYTMKMKYKPTITSPSPPELFFYENETVTLRCDADANPAAKIKWYKESSPTELSKDNNLTLHKLQYSDQGTYLCKASSEDPLFEPATRQFKININGPPRVDIRSMIYGRKGAENFKLHCHVRSPPDSDTKIIWKRGNEELITADDDHYSTYLYTDGIANFRSVLTIRKVEPSDFGIYNCTAQNRLGATPDTGVTHLVQAEEFPTYAILGVAGGCLAILALALALIIVNRKYLCRSKSSTNGDDASEIHMKVECWDNGRFIIPPEMYSANGDNEHIQSKNHTYTALSQDNPDLDYDHPSLPPPYPYYTAPAMTNTTFVNGTVTSNYMNHYGHSSPGNGHLSHVTYLGDSLSPTTTTTTVTTSLQGDQRAPNGYRPLSPLSPTTAAKLQNGFSQSPSLSQYRQMQYQPYNRYGLAQVDLLSGHSVDAATGLGFHPPNGHCIVPAVADQYAFAIDGASIYYPSTSFGSQQPYYPGVNSSPLEPVQEVATPDAVDDLPHPPPLANQDHRQVRRSTSASDSVARCSSQLSTHV